MELEINELPEIAVISLTGKVMSGNDEEIFIKNVYDLIDKGFTNIILDMSAVDWMNSRGLGMCLKAMTSLRNRGGDLKLAGVGGQTREIMEKCRIFDIFNYFPDVETALDSY
ncbi:MAG: STAS domain-containing protein [Candidatus Zixiibacteriota bacterium]